VPRRAIFFAKSSKRTHAFPAFNHQSSITPAFHQNEPKPRHPVALQYHLFGEISEFPIEASEPLFFQATIERNEPTPRHP